MTHPNVEVVERWYEALRTRDFDAIPILVDPEVVVWQTPELPWGGEWHGHDGLTNFFLTLVGTITSAVTTSGMWAAGDKVVQVGKTAGTVNANGAAFDVDEMHLFTIRDGKIVRFEAHIDTPAMLAAIGGA